ncbi:hypothetical protein [Pelotomaculum schinkii]|uniref:hypothetical protein n=1 Tax=Pelotomaculum schinkii TaxID=78350 RepID=UPI00167D438A|nr:hypothetical protein [Pelotomaculum schinkii]
MIRKKKKKNLYRRAKTRINNFLYKNRLNLNVAFACLLILAAIAFVLEMMN